MDVLWRSSKQGSATASDTGGTCGEGRHSYERQMRNRRSSEGAMKAVQVKVTARTRPRN